MKSERLLRASLRAERRMRIVRALDAFVSHLAVALLVCALVLLAQRIWTAFPAWLARDLVLAAGLQILLGVAFASLRKLPKLAGAMALDAHHELHGRIANALSFAELPASDRTPFMEAAILDASEKASLLSPTKAVPFEKPRHLVQASGLAVLVVGLVLAPKAKDDVPVALPRATTIEPVSLHDEDVELFRAVAKELGQGDKSEDVRAAAEQLNQLIEDISEQRLDRATAFRKLSEIERSVVEKRAPNAEALDEQLRQRAKALRGSELLKPMADALEKRDWALAEKALRELALRMREKPESFDEQQLERLREAMKKAAGSQGERLAELARLREELERELLRKREQQEAGRGEGDERLLRREERKLEHLSRERAEVERAGRQLDRLDRELARAAEDLLRELGMTADDLERGAEDINRLAREEMSEADREEMLQRLQDLREQLRQGGQGAEGEKRLARLRRFGRMARGEGAGAGGGERGGGRGGGREGGREGGGEGEGESAGTGAGAGSEEKVLVVSPGGAQATAGGQGAGKEAGGGHDPSVSGKATDSRMGTRDVTAVGLDTGQGATRSSVILGASEKGFRGGGYKRVYTEYRTAAEEQLHGEEIPPGTSSHVRRYFDLIRPRD